MSRTESVEFSLVLKKPSTTQHKMMGQGLRVTKKKMMKESRKGQVVGALKREEEGQGGLQLILSPALTCSNCGKKSFRDGDKLRQVCPECGQEEEEGAEEEREEEQLPSRDSIYAALVKRMAAPPAAAWDEESSSSAESRAESEEPEEELLAKVTALPGDVTLVLRPPVPCSKCGALFFKRSRQHSVCERCEEEENLARLRAMDGYLLLEDLRKCLVGDREIPPQVTEEESSSEISDEESEEDLARAANALEEEEEEEEDATQQSNANGSGGPMDAVLRAGEEAPSSSDEESRGTAADDEESSDISDDEEYQGEEDHW